MAVYRIKPEKDTFISSEPAISGVYRNAGKDPILQIAGYPDANDVGRTQRALIKFSSADINTGLNLAGNSFNSTLKLYVAEAKELPTTFTVYVNPITSDWQEGVGQYSDEPVSQTGTTWTNNSITSTWTTPGGDYSNSYSSSYSFNNSDSLDLNLNVSEYVSAVSSSTITDYGLIVRLQEDYEAFTSQSISLSYYGKDSHTIFKPFLEFAWDDSIYNTGDLDILNTDNCLIRINNIKSEYKNSDKFRFRITSRPQYPAKTFATSSVKPNYALPQNSLWGIKDEFTNEMIIDFHSTNTKISADSTGSYFDFYLSSLYPERYYRILVKTTIGESTFYIEDDKPFKVIK